MAKGVPLPVSIAVMVLITGAVFTVGMLTNLLGPYSDTLHLVILSATLTFTYLGWVTAYGRRRG